MSMEIDVSGMDFMEADVAEEVVVGGAGDASFEAERLGDMGQQLTPDIKQEAQEHRQPTVIQVHPSQANPRVIRIQTSQPAQAPASRPIRVIKLPVQKVANQSGSVKVITLPPRSQAARPTPTMPQASTMATLATLGAGGQPQPGQTLRVITATGAQKIIQVRSLPTHARKRVEAPARTFIIDKPKQLPRPIARTSAGRSASYDDWIDDDDYGGSGTRGGSGLRKYAGAVVEKLQKKQTSSYYEVADELVHEFAAEHPLMPQDQLIYHQKNIRRRAYDTLNVLLAMGVIKRDNKEICWVGMPLNAIVQCRKLQEEREERLRRIRDKANEVSEQVCQLIAFKQLVKRNRENEQMCGPPPRASQLPLPFLVISCPPNTVTDCNITKDKLEYLFTFDHTFEISDDTAALRSLGFQLATASEPVDDMMENVPPSLRFFVNALYERREAVVPDFEAVHAQRKIEAANASAALAVPQIIQAIPSAVVGHSGQLVQLSDSELEEEGSDIEVEVGA